MKITITESQFNKLVESYDLVEDNDYFNYDNISDAQKQAFYRDKAGYGPIRVKKPKPVPKYVELWMPVHVDLLTPQNADRIRTGKWIFINPFAQWAFAEKWVKTKYPRLTKEYYRIIPKYE